MIALGERRLKPGEEYSGSEEDFQYVLTQLNRIGTLKSRSGGGSAANTTFALGRMGFPTKFIGNVGNDEEGDFILNSLGPVQTGLIHRDQCTGVCLVVLDRHHDRFLFLRGNANNTLSLDGISIETLGDVSWIHLSSFIDELPFEAQKDLVNRLDPAVKVSMDPGEIYARKGLGKLSPLIQRCHILFLTEKEVTLLTARDLHSGVRALLEAGPKILVCKRGSQGSQVFTESGDFEIPARPVTVVDNTGAGDVYNAGFLAGFFLGSPLEVCALFATEVASKSVTGYGRTCYPNRDDFEHFFGTGL